MVAARRVITLSIDPDQRRALVDISRSRSEATGRVERARMIIAYLDTPSAYVVARQIGVSQQTVTRCLERAAELGGKAPLLHCGLDGDGERSRPAAGILAGNDAIDPRHSERAGDIHGQDLGMGMRRAQDRRMQCVRPNREIVAKAPVASQQISVFEAADRTPGIGGLRRLAALVHGAARRGRRPGRHFPRNSGLRFW